MMKKKKTCLVVGSVSIVIGIALVAVSIAFGGFPSQSANKLKERINEVLVSGNSETQVSVEETDYSFTTEDVDKIDQQQNSEIRSWTGSQQSLPNIQLSELQVMLDHSSVEIVTGDQFRVETDVDASIECYLDGDILTVEENGSWFEFSTKDGFKNNSSKVKITILPSQLSYLEISTGAGNIKLSDIVTDELSISAGAGTVKAKNVTASISNLESGAGNVSVTDFVGTEDTNITCGVGMIKIEGTLLNSTTIEGGVGMVELNIHGSIDDYGISAESGMGTVKVNGQKVSSFFGAQYETESGNNNQIYVEGGMGSVDINFSE